MTFHPDSLPDLTGKVYIVTGGNSGIGYYTVARLAQHGAHVYLCARSPAKGNAAISGIKSLYPQVHISLLEIDHLSLSSVVSAAKIFLSKETALHGLINNAGIMATPFEMSKDEHEAQWQTNYLAHWTSPGSVRIVNVSSVGHTLAPAGGINFNDTSLSKGTGMSRYGQSKLANVLHAKTLNRLYGPNSPSSKDGEGEIWTSSVHPGLVKSELGTHAEIPGWMRIPINLYSAFGGAWHADKGAWTSVFCAASQNMVEGQSGTYFQRIAEAGSENSLAKDRQLGNKLEEWTKIEMKKEDWIE